MNRRPCLHPDPSPPEISLGFGARVPIDKSHSRGRCRHVNSPGALAGSSDHRSRRPQRERAARALEMPAAPGAAARRRSGRPHRRAARAPSRVASAARHPEDTAARRARRWRRRAAVVGRSRSRAGSAKPSGTADVSTPRPTAAATTRRVRRPSRRRHACALRTLAHTPRERDARVRPREVSRGRWAAKPCRRFAVWRSDLGLP